MASEEEIKKLREKFSERLETLEKIKAEETAKNEKLYIRMKRNKEIYNRVYEVQRETFFNNSAKKWNIEKNEIEELFKEFWYEFETGKINSIREFLLDRKYKIKEKANI